jgi:phosphoribosylformylglycinamidine cyclo-ligase
VKPVLALLERIRVKGMAHITGGGFIENIPRTLPQHVDVRIDYGSWPILPVFQLIQSKGSIRLRDMFTTFNMGIGMVLIVAAEDAEEAVRIAEAQGEQVYRIGEVTEGSRRVVFQGADV